MSLANLISLIRPPDNPVDAGTAEQWEMIQRDLGARLPDDFREFGRTYGTGSIVDPGHIEIFVYQPFSTEFLEKAQFHIANLEGFRIGEGESYVPFPVFPEASGLLAWGGDCNGNELYWATEHDPNSWPIVVRSETNDYQEFPGPLTAFLVNALTRSISVDIWPEPFFMKPAALRYIPLPKGASMEVFPTSIYVLYTQNDNRAGFWVKDIGAQVGVTYYIKSIDGKIDGPLRGIPDEYERQPVVADLYLKGRLFQSDLPIGHAYQRVFVGTDPPL